MVQFIVVVVAIDAGILIVLKLSLVALISSLSSKF
jgi:hypothetical protein